MQAMLTKGAAMTASQGAAIVLTVAGDHRIHSMAAPRRPSSRPASRESIAWLLVIGAAIVILVLVLRSGPEVAPRSEQSANDVSSPITGVVVAQELVRFEAEIVGEVMLRGAAPTMHEIDPWTDPKCQLRSHATEEDVLVQDGKLENVFVRVVRPNSEARRSLQRSRSGRPLIVNQQIHEVGCTFSPRVSRGSLGFTMVIVNTDNTSHDLTATLDGRLLLHTVQPPRSSGVELPLEAAGIIELRSANQPWTKGYVVVSDDLRHSDVTTSSGRFRLGRLAVGAYTIEGDHLVANASGAATRNGSTPPSRSTPCSHSCPERARP
jgi:hypothetical protein